MMPARLEESSRDDAPPPIGSIGTTSPSWEALADMSAGMDCATPRKKSSMYWREAGSYCVAGKGTKGQPCEGRSLTRGGGEATNIDLHGIAIGEAAHVALGKEAVGKQGEQDEFRERQQLVPRQDKASSPVYMGHLGQQGHSLSIFIAA